MKKITLLLIVLFLSFAIPAFSAPQDLPGYVFHSKIGVMRVVANSVFAQQFDTYEDLTKDKETIVGFQEATKSAEKKLTPLGNDLRQRLMKDPDVRGVAVSFRAFVIQIFPLSNWAEVNKRMEKIFGKDN